MEREMVTKHKIIFGNCMSMMELSDESVHFIVTSPPYFNAPFDYKGLFKNYEQYLGMLKRVAKESYRVWLSQEKDSSLEPYYIR